MAGMEPNKGSAAAAVETLRAELAMVDGALSSIDQKAALIPALLGAVTGIVIAPDTNITELQAGLLVVALVFGAVAGGLALRVLWARDLNMGPDATLTVSATYLKPADFNVSVADSLARSVNALSKVAKWKGGLLNRAMICAATAILFLVLTRMAGGIGVSDQKPTQATPQAPATTPAQQPTPATADRPPGQVVVPVDLGQQIAAKGGLPSDLGKLTDRIEKRG